MTKEFKPSQHPDRYGLAGVEVDVGDADYTVRVTVHEDDALEDVAHTAMLRPQEARKLAASLLAAVAVQERAKAVDARENQKREKEMAARRKANAPLIRAQERAMMEEMRRHQDSLGDPISDFNPASRW